jgi:ABC-type sugar transport system permease subunit
MLFSSPGGTINNILKILGLSSQAINFAYSPFLSRLVIGLAICWQNFGYNVIFFTAGLNSISRDVYEAAEVDGANSIQKTLKITLPLMKPILIYVMITSIIGGLQIFDVSTMVFKDVPGNMTTTMVQYMYESAFKRWQLGYGAAAAYGIFVIIAIFSLISLKVTTRKNKEDGEAA